MSINFYHVVKLTNVFINLKLDDIYPYIYQNRNLCQCFLFIKNKICEKKPLNLPRLLTNGVLKGF